MRSVGKTTTGQITPEPHLDYQGTPNRRSYVSAKSVVLGLAAVALLSFAATPSLADSRSASNADSSCFAASQWNGWKSPSPSVIYLRVGVNDIYRLDLSYGSSELDEPDVHLISLLRGSDWICSPLDLQLAVADDSGGFREPLIVRSITRLTPAQIAAIPPKFRP